MTEQPTGDVAGRCVLDEAKRRTIVALVANGSSRRVAARYVGCAPSTITRTAARDPDFSQQLARAEHYAEIDALRYLRSAAKKDRYWRAAAWLLERRNPDDFAARAPTTYTGQEVIQMLVMIMLSGEIPEKYCQRAVERLERLLAEAENPGAPERPQDARQAAASCGQEKAPVPSGPVSGRRRARRRRKRRKQCNTSP